MRPLRATVAILIVVLPAPAASASNDPFLGYESPIFPNPVTSTRGNEPWGMHAGDFNDDGHVDLAVNGESGLAILLGRGNCVFDRAYYPVFGGGPGALGDFNEDGYEDIVQGEVGSHVFVVLGNPDGTFGAPLALTQPFGNVIPWGVAVADFNEDNDLDILVGFYGGAADDYAFYAGNGDGTFAAAVTFGHGAAWSVGVADFNEDGNLDFIAGRLTPQVRMGTGTGAFVDAGTYSMGTDPEALLVFDFNGDSYADFVTANETSNDVTVRLGNGDGTFAAASSYPVADGPRFLAIAETDGDGHEELFVGYWGEELVSRLPGNGDGTFDPAETVPLVHSGGPMVIEDFNGDGIVDLAVASAGWDEVTVLRGNGDGTFSEPDDALVISSTTWPVSATTLGDLDGDGKLDAVLVDDNGATVTVMLADGTGVFSDSDTEAAGVSPSDAVVVDVDNDTFPDVVVSDFGAISASVLLGNGDGTLMPATAIAAAREVVSIASGSFDGNADADLALLSLNPSDAVRALLGNGDGTFAGGSYFPVGAGPIAVESGDFDEDGVTDLVTVNTGSDDLSVLIGVGDGTFEAEVRYTPAVLPDNSVVIVADANADGHQDLLLPESDHTVFYGVGDGTFGAPAQLPQELGEFTRRYVVGDVNGDGRSDLVGTGRQVQLQLRDAGGTLGEQTFFVTSHSNGIDHMALDDTDGDGRNDIVMTTNTGVTVLLNVEQAPFNFLTDKVTLHWPEVGGALSYNVYRGLVSDLVDGDQDGYPDGDYGACQNAADPNTTDLVYVDAALPPAGDGYYYLIAWVDGTGERGLGLTSAGQYRVPTTVCP